MIIPYLNSAAASHVVSSFARPARDAPTCVLSKTLTGSTAVLPLALLDAVGAGSARFCRTPAEALCVSRGASGAACCCLLPAPGQQKERKDEKRESADLQRSHCEDPPGFELSPIGPSRSIAPRVQRDYSPSLHAQVPVIEGEPLSEVSNAILVVNNGTASGSGSRRTSLGR